MVELAVFLPPHSVQILTHRRTPEEFEITICSSQQLKMKSYRQNPGCVLCCTCCQPANLSLPRTRTWHARLRCQLRTFRRMDQATWPRSYVRLFFGQPRKLKFSTAIKSWQCLGDYFCIRVFTRNCFLHDRCGPTLSNMTFVRAWLD